MQKYKKQKNGKYVANVWDGTYNANGPKHRKYIYSSKSSRDLEEKVAAFKRAVKARTTFLGIFQGMVPAVQGIHGHEDEGDV